MHQNSSLFGDAQVEKVGNPEKNMWKLKEPSDENQTERHEIKPNLWKDRAHKIHLHKTHAYTLDIKKNTKSKGIADALFTNTSSKYTI
jgi:hypothetical protein